MHQNFPTNDFLDWYLDYGCNNTELILLKQHPEAFRELQNKKINSLVAKNPEIKEANLVAQYIEKNAELLKNNSELVQRNNELFKKVQELQEIRDNNENLLNESAKVYSLANKLIQIFIDQKIKADLTEEEIQLVKELSA